MGRDEMTMSIALSFIHGGRYDGALGVKVPATYLDKIKDIPGSRWATLEQTQVVPARWPSALALGTLSNQLGLPLAPDAEVVAWYRNQVQEWKDLRANSSTLEIGEKLPGLSYYPHQLAGAKWLLEGGQDTGRLLLDQTGAGKTGTVIRALQQGKLASEGPILVIAPESVMSTGWVAPLGRFAPELRVVEITGTPTQRRKIFAALQAGEYDIAVIGYSNLRTHTRFEAFGGQSLKRCIECGGPRLTIGSLDVDGNVIPTIDPETGKTIKEVTVAACQTHLKELNTIPWSVIIADEAHRAMNAKSQTTQALWGVAHHAPSEPRRWALTGSPVSKHVDQVWPLLHFIDPVAWPVKSKWIDWYCEAGMNWAGFFEVFGLKDSRKDEFHATFSGVSRRVLKEQVLDLPPQLRWDSLERRLTLSGEQKRVYEEMRDEMLAMVDEGVITASNAIVHAGRLSMLATATGFPDAQDETKLRLKLPSVKWEAFLTDWRNGEFEDQQVGMLFSSSHALRVFEQAMYEHDIVTPHTVGIIDGAVSQRDRTWYIDEFQAGKRKFMLLTYAAGGEGITLTAASTVAVIERHWSPIKNAQAIDRFHRIGSERHAAITYLDYTVGNTIEMKQLRTMQKDSETLEAIVQDKARLRELFT